MAYGELALGPDQLSALEMGYVYEELLRRFSEQSAEEECVGIQLLDHIIFNRAGYFSFLEEGKL